MNLVAIDAFRHRRPAGMKRIPGRLVHGQAFVRALLDKRNGRHRIDIVRRHFDDDHDAKNEDAEDEKSVLAHDIPLERTFARSSSYFNTIA